jgi:putative endonuclease
MYVGVTNDLNRRLYEHREGLVDGFTKKYNVHKLVYCEEVGNVNDATDHLKKALSIYAKIWSEQPELIEQKYAELQEDFMKAGIRMVPPDQYFLLKN